MENGAIKEIVSAMSRIDMLVCLKTDNWKRECLTDTVVTVRCMKACGRTRGIVTLILNVGTG
jgi:hypothetical protein